MGEILPLALGIAISPVPIIAGILMLLAPRARATSSGFSLGWFFRVVVAVALFVVLAAALGLGRRLRTLEPGLSGQAGPRGSAGGSGPTSVADPTGGR